MHATTSYPKPNNLQKIRKKDSFIKCQILVNYLGSNLFKQFIVASKKNLIKNFIPIFELIESSYRQE